MSMLSVQKLYLQICITFDMMLVLYELIIYCKNIKGHTYHRLQPYFSILALDASMIDMSGTQSLRYPAVKEQHRSDPAIYL
jgi:hypothetical protein